MATRRKKITAEQFCEAYHTASVNGQSYEDLARTLGVSRAAVHTRKSYYAKRGVRFPSLRESASPGNRTISVPGLNAILAGRVATKTR